jgi:shikimate dehydrogenase
VEGRFAFDSCYDHYGVVGYPITHSLSPRIHTAFAEETRQALHYHAILVTPGRLPEALAEFKRAGGRGLNVTLPFKEEARLLADRLSPRAQLAEAVNTLSFAAEGGSDGDNTDGVGFLRDYLENHEGTLSGRQVLILGAGGAVRGLLGPLLGQLPARVVLANRSLGKAQALEDRFRALGVVEACGYAALAGQRFEVIINATPSGLTAGLPPLPAGILATGGWCYDLVYASEPTPFVRWALAQGADRALDGLGMLVEQAAEAFFIWRGVRPATAAVIRMLRAGDDRN